MSTERPKRRPGKDRPTDTPADPWMQTCANCDQSALLAVSGAAQDGRLQHRSIPLCPKCSTALLQLQGTPALLGAMYALCFQMEQRTGEEWASTADDE